MHALVLRDVQWYVVATYVGRHSRIRCVCMDAAVLVSFSPSSLEYLQALCLTTLKSFSHLSSEDSHFPTTPLFGSKT